MVKKPGEEHEQFIFQVGSPSWSYHFAVQQDRRELDSYWEHQSLTLAAHCLHPDRFKEREAQVRVIGSRDLAERDRTRGGSKPPNGVGITEIRGQRFEVILSLPIDACWHVGHAIATGSIRYVLTHGPRVFRGTALIRSVSFDGPSLVLDDYTA